MAPAILATRPKILYLDAYDSFSNNIIAQVEQCVDADVVKLVIDDPRFGSHKHRDSRVKADFSTDDPTTFADYLKNFDAVIAGPGPGSAKCEKDVGLMNELWKLQEEEMVPVLGICLGFQSLCLAYGADIQRLNEPRHGLVAEILHKGRSIFKDIEQLETTQYHSLQVMIGHPIQTRRAVRHPAELWSPTSTCPDLEPLAWDFDSKRNGAVLMGVKHTQKPLWGVQFHPESICTNEEGIHIIQNWWEDVQGWNRKHMLGRVPKRNTLSLTRVRPIDDNNFRCQITHEASFKGNQHCKPSELASLIAHGDGKTLPNLPPSVVHCATTGSGRLTVSDVCELLGIPRNEAIVLESGLQPDLLPMAVGTGRYSIIGLIIPGETLRLHYYAGPGTMQLRNGNDGIHTGWRVSDPWSYIRGVMKKLQPTAPPSTPTWAPFWGGLMGYASYEAGLETIDVDPSGMAERPDICFAYITRSIIFDHQVKKIYVQSIRGPNDKTWVEATLEQIYEAVGRKSQESTPSPTPLPNSDPFEKSQADTVLNNYIASCKQYVANREEYCASVESCQESIAKGESYELCLTTTNEVRARRPSICKKSFSDNNELSWKLYKGLNSQNPAPFGAYMRLHNMHILSSSPERYISWDRSQTASCRPIKGTVAKHPGVTAADAHAILSSSKERAENLMIVDLVRHQLHGVYGSGNVHVQQLMEVEEYETLWQLVSVIDAIPQSIYRSQTPDEWEDPRVYVSENGSTTSDEDEESVPYLGFDAFVRSLPPGSMTGAPKKRSCEILRNVEGESHRRGIYSGVMGYLDVGGGGDFSVVIRTAVKIDNLEEDDDEDVWKIGAGGAITAQSTPSSEYEEMLGKFRSTARAFEPRIPAPQKRAKSKLFWSLTPDDVEEVTSPGDGHIPLANGEWSRLDDVVNEVDLRRLEDEIRRFAAAAAAAAGDAED